MTAKTIMVQGTASSVGKSILVTALCRIFKQDGYKVAPFKSQNMALNSFVTKEGGEIGRAQAVQAESAGIEPSIHMNPVLLKPEANSKSQVIVLGKVYRNLEANRYQDYAPYLLGIIRDSLDYLRSQYDIIVIEGAGSPAEINLQEHEIVNMRIARLAEAPVLLVGDIDRGGVFASLVGTLMLLKEDERARVKGLIINKFRGDLSLLKAGLDMLEQKAGKPVLGVIPYIRDIKIAQEDSVYLDEKPDGPTDKDLDIAIIRLPHISNYDDFDPLEEMGCNCRYITESSDLGNPDLIVIPGTKSTIHDLRFIRENGLEAVIQSRSRNGTPVMGICGGFQILGQRINDPFHAESAEGSTEGLKLIDTETVFRDEKTTTQVRARVVASEGLFKGLEGQEVTGYEIHMGQVDKQNDPPLFRTLGASEYFDGAANRDFPVFGTYLHGLFHNPDFTKAFLNGLRRLKGLPEISAVSRKKDDSYDALADIVRQNLNMAEIYKILRQV
jgi:adenosylcobyric acid synthase